MLVNTTNRIFNSSPFIWENAEGKPNLCIGITNNGMCYQFDHALFQTFYYFFRVMWKPYRLKKRETSSHKRTHYILRSDFNGAVNRLESKIDGI